MSKINKLRIVNLNYNNNSIKIVDETFNLNGESTLLSLRNGGGKSVLVQMMTAPFVNKKYRSTADRPFSSYFTTNKATVIMVEWVLDDFNTYVMTGMLVRANQDPDSDDSLQINNFTVEYKKPCDIDIDNILFTKKTEKGVELKSYTKCLKMLEDYKKNDRYKLNYYDMNSSTRSRDYFKELKKYQINHTEWESIIRKINKQESGLSNLFSNCKDVKGLVEKWFLKTIDDKLNAEDNKINNFRELTDIYIRDIKKNESIINKKENILEFNIDGNQIKNIIVNYVNSTDKKTHYENYLAAYFLDIIGILKICNNEIKDLDNLKTELYEKINRTKYNEFSYKIYKINQDLKKCFELKNQLEIEKNSLEISMENNSHSIHIFEASKQNKKLLNQKKKLDSLEAKLETAKLENNELRPEEDEFGGKIKTYYDKLYDDKKIEQEKVTEEISDIEGRLVKYKKEIKQIDEDIEKESEIRGSLNSNISHYGDYEKDYNNKYNEDLMRNILGLYKPGEIEIRKGNIEESKNELDRNHKDALKNHDKISRNFVEFQAEEREVSKNETEVNYKLKELYKVKKNIDDKINQRLNIFKYLQLSEEDLYDIEKINSRIDHKLKEIDDVKNSYRFKRDSLEKEQKKLKEGKILELTEEFKTALEREDIKYIYGMNWLKENKYDKDKNASIIRDNPFIPYSIILQNELDYQKLKALEVYSLIPVPILLRSNIETVVNYENVIFYTEFDINLMEEDYLESVIAKISNDINELNENYSIKAEEYKNYSEKQAVINDQNITEKQVKDIVKNITKSEQDFENIKKRKIELSNIIVDLKIKIDKSSALIKELSAKITVIDDKKSRFDKLCTRYGEYIAYKNDLAELRKRVESLKSRKNNKEKLQISLEIKKLNLDGKSRKLISDINDYKDKLVTFNKYKEISDLDINEIDISKLEALYSELRNKYNGDEKNLQEDLDDRKKNYLEEEEELKNLVEKYMVSKDEYENTLYDEIQVKNAEKMKVELEKSEKKLTQEININGNNSAIFEERKKNFVEEMKRACNTEEPCNIKEIDSFEFDKDIAVCNDNIRKNEKHRKEKEKRRELLNSVKESLSEYEGMDITESIEIPNINEWSNKEISNHKGECVRDYNNIKNEIDSIRMELISLIDHIIRKEIYQDMFFKQPLETLTRLIDNPHNMMNQLIVTLDSFKNILEKLEADISVLNKEKEIRIGLFVDYVKEINENMNKIDKNSTIKIRDRSIKMLQITVPNFEENLNIYKNRVNDYLEKIKKECIDLLNKNENIKEYIDRNITTIKLYDEIVGNNNINVKLYKIEESKEYVISWKEVSKNSGGEGFLSAFVILSSLLYFMRKDDADIWAKNNESKVLLMDNPFAQANASHLTKPLMDMAKKTNTQLICLTGLSGKSIYDRFDNIYVLDLIPSNYKSTELLEARHIKGDLVETESMVNEIVSSHIEVFEQQKLF